MTKKQITIYTDGGSKPNPGPGGWAALLIYGDIRKAISGGEADTTNNRMEMTAAIEALNALNEPCQVDLYTDSEYLKNGITQWLAGWQRSGWKTASRNPVKNKDLWLKLVAAIAQHDVNWHWVRGHAGVDGNERVDQLAAEARKPYEA